MTASILGSSCERTCGLQKGLKGNADRHARLVVITLTRERHTELLLKDDMKKPNGSSLAVEKSQI